MPADIRNATASAQRIRTALVVDGLVAEAPNGVRLLDGVSFAVSAGSMLAVAGPTGAGKTSLAAAITGAIPLSSGAVIVGGVDVTRSDSSRRGIGYVPQEDDLHGELTVRQTLDYAAELRLPFSEAGERQACVDRVLAEVRLQPQSGTTVASLSVGQRKRVSIASELISRPEVLVLDEPTSSLDPGYEASVMVTLRRLAERGKCIVVVTHSQQVIAACDQVAMLATGGGLAYFGATSCVHSYFGTSSPAELFSLLDDAPDSIFIPKPPAAVRCLPGSVPIRVARRCGLAQFMTLSRRYARITFADRRRTALFAIQALALGVLLLAFVTPAGLARPQDALGQTIPLSATGMAVLLTTCVTWLGTSNAIREIVKERKILARERRAGLSAHAYVVSKLAVLGPLVAVQAAVVAAISVQRQQVPGAGAVLPVGILELIVAMSLGAICAVTLAMFVSAVVRTADKALAVLPMVVVVEFVLSGLSPSVHVPGLSLLRDLAAARWSVQAIGATVTGSAYDWWQAIGSMAALSALALVGTLLTVHRSLRTRPVRRSRRAVVPAGLKVGARLNPEMLRLSRVAAGGLAGVALVVTGARVLVPEAAAPAPAAAAATAGQGGHPVSLLAESVPGVVGDLFWLLRAGTTVGIDVTAAAYVESVVG
ncbi:MAG TPA: ATP-binding cassette domain-containing protein [Mycobacteriales bacterium]|jgi:ABC-type multidrug transport system ATPase subunit|nr:ATP-binding cassette domain-containing protein [Mycobacteriales bacterium]